MDALKYSGYMGSLYSSTASTENSLNSPGAAAIKSMYSSPELQTSISSSGKYHPFVNSQVPPKDPWGDSMMY